MCLVWFVHVFCIRSMEYANFHNRNFVFILASAPARNPPFFAHACQHHQPVVCVCFAESVHGKGGSLGDSA